MKTTKIDHKEAKIMVKDLERMLKYALTPIMPNEEFIRNLNGQLLREHTLKTHKEVHDFLLIATSIISMVALFILSVRSIIVMLGTLGLLTHFRQGIKKRKVTNFSQC